MASKFVIQVVEKATGQVVEWAPGFPVERQFVDDLCNRVEAKKVGFGRTSKQVVAHVRASLEELLHELKSEVKPSR